MATPSSILAQRIPWTEEPDGITVHGVTKSGDKLARVHGQYTCYRNTDAKAVIGMDRTS